MGSKGCRPEQCGGREPGGASMRPAATSAGACTGLKPACSTRAPHKIPGDDGKWRGEEYPGWRATRAHPVGSGAAMRVPDIVGSSSQIQREPGKSSTTREGCHAPSKEEIKRPLGKGREREDQGLDDDGDARLDGVP